jgi:hypothetical protein
MARHVHATDLIFIKATGPRQPCPQGEIVPLTDRAAPRAPPVRSATAAWELIFGESAPIASSY